ncbi:MAG: exo-alpha-sialidase [Candidatus Thermoplasmatota archaeon]|nr:exo-alpha-sialidase [Candidatus Thermoplasmatota archaeon]
MDLNRNRLLVLMIGSLMLAPLLSVTSDDAEGGKPIFQASREVLSGTDRLNVQITIDMQVGPTGRVFVLYQTMKAYSWDVYLVYSDDDGDTWSTPVRVDDTLLDGNSSNDDTDQLNPRMDIGPDGSVNVVWEDWRNWLDDVFTRPVDIRFSRSADGTSFGPSKVVTPHKQINTWDAFTPDICINEDGRIFCVWSDEMEAGAYKNIWSSYSTDNGASWSAPININTDEIHYRNHFQPRCAIHEDDVYVTWHDKRNTTMGTKPYLAISRDGGATFQEEFPITTDTQVDAHREFAMPLVDEAGSLFITWMDDRTERDEIFFTRSDDGGLTFSLDTRVLSLPDDTGDHDPFMTASGSGRLGLVWEREVTFSTGSELEVYYTNSSDGGRTWAPILRVDDTDRFQVDRTDQRDIVMAYDHDGRALCVYASNWNVEGVEGSYDYNLFFTRHSKSLNEVNHMPELLDPDFLGQSLFDHVVGNTETLYNFTMTYRDVDNDEPAAGYPRVQIFRDPEGTDPVYDDWVPMVKVKGEKDFYYMDGVEYHVKLNVTEEGQFYWRMQVNDGVDPSSISSEVFSGPLIDTKPPTLEITAPQGGVWYAAKSIECRVIVRDTGGAGVENRSIRFMKSIRGKDLFETPVAVKGFQRIDNDTYEAWANITLSSGTENYVKFVAKDRVGNGFAESDHINIWLDPDAPFAVDPRPHGDYVNIYGQVNCSIIWRDANPGSTLVNFTGLDPTSFRYSTRNTSEGFSDWRTVDGQMRIGEESFIVWVNVTFPDEGVYNFIRWRAADNAGNIFETPGYRITVDIPDNYRPILLGAGYPQIISSPTPHLWWDDAFDEEDDALYYRVMLLKHPTRLQLTGWFDLGKRSYFDVPDDESLEPNYYVLRINVTDRIGGWDVMDHVFRVIDTGTPPPEEVPDLPMFTTSDPDSDIEWTISPSHGPTTGYLIRIGTEDHGGDVLEWTDVGHDTTFALEGLGLGIGMYSVQIMVHDGGNYSRVTSGYLKINDYSLRTEHPQEHEAFKGEKGIRITKPLICQIINNATFNDNVTIILQGELVEENWAYLTASEGPQYVLYVNSSKGFSVDRPEEFKITIAAPDTAKNGDHVLSYRLVSEDGKHTIYSGDIRITIKNAPDDGGTDNFADDLSGVITDVLPFLKGLPPGFVITIFLIIFFLLVGGTIFFGILIAKRRDERKKKDPLAEQKRIYREIYGREPTEEEIMLMRSQSEQEQSVDEFVGRGAPSTGDAPKTSRDIAPAGDQGPTVEKSEAVEELPAPEGERAGSGDREADDLLDRLFD